GIGNHAVTNEEEYRKTCRTACRKDSTWTNAGTGSNLTESGTVECDASLMDGKTMGFGAVGAIRRVKNPSQVAHHILRDEIKGPKTLGLVPPVFLVGEGAECWARDYGIPGVTEQSLITEKSLASYHRYKERLNSTKPSELHQPKKQKLDDMDVLEDSSLDTVGVVCVDTAGCVSAGSSSGGLLLKKPGRVGQAAVYGAGCYARNTTHSSVKRCGELLIKTLLAKECA
ncbi:predicted protein, partial [Nematostella vectensis]